MNLKNLMGEASSGTSSNQTGNSSRDFALFANAWALCNSIAMPFNKLKVNSSKVKS